MMFQAEMETEMYLGEDQGDNSLETNVLSSAICIETLVNMRTVYSKENYGKKGDDISKNVCAKFGPRDEQLKFYLFELQECASLSHTFER